MARLQTPDSNVSFLACPTDIVDAPVDVVWALLTDFSGWGRFYDVRVKSVEPPGPAAPGQRMIGETGPRWLHLTIDFVYTRIDDARYQLEIDGKMPLGMRVHENLDCIPMKDDRCRVNYHCHFGFPTTWRGRLLRLLLGRELSAGPLDSLQRLKRAAEQMHRAK
jgi:hypothetical protein